MTEMRGRAAEYLRAKRDDIMEIVQKKAPALGGYVRPEDGKTVFHKLVREAEDGQHDCLAMAGDFQAIVEAKLVVIRDTRARVMNFLLDKRESLTAFANEKLATLGHVREFEAGEDVYQALVENALAGRFDDVEKVHQTYFRKVVALELAEHSQVGARQRGTDKEYHDSCEIAHAEAQARLVRQENLEDVFREFIRYLHNRKGEARVISKLLTQGRAALAKSEHAPTEELRKVAAALLGDWPWKKVVAELRWRMYSCQLSDGRTFQEIIRPSARPEDFISFSEAHARVDKIFHGSSYYIRRFYGAVRNGIIMYVGLKRQKRTHDGRLIQGGRMLYSTLKVHGGDVDRWIAEECKRRSLAKTP